MAKTAWGIELGTSSVKAVKLSDDRGSVTLDALSITSLKDFGLGAGTTKEQASAGALNDLRVRAGIKKGEQVFISITGQNTLGRIISLPPVSMEKVRDTIQNEARSQIPIKLEEAVWDYQVIDDPANVDELKVNLYAAKRQAVDEIVDICETAGLDITGIQVAPLGIYNYIKYEMDAAISDGCVAIDIGAENTDLVVIDGQKTYVRVVPVAGNDITKALRARFKISAEDAERLKRTAGKSKDAAQVFEAMKPPLKEMVGEIYRAVGFYKSQNEQANINQLVMMGNGSKLLNIQKFFEQQLQYKVHKVETPARIQLSRAVDPAEVQDNIQSLAVATGLALQGLGLDGINNINLMPPERLEAREKAKLRVPVIVSGALIMAGGLVAFLLSMMSTSGVGNVQTAATNATKKAGERKSEWNKALTNDDFDLKALSFKNLALGNVASYQPAAAEGEEAPPPVRFNISASEVPIMLGRAVEEALAEYASTNKKYDATRVNFVDGVQGFSNGATLLGAVTTAPGWEGEGEKGFYKADREAKYEIAVAMSASDSEVSSAKNDLEKALAGPEGLVAAKLRAMIFERLEATGQLDVLPKDKDGKRALNKITLNNFTAIVSYTSVGARAVRYVSGTEVRMPRQPFKLDTSTSPQKSQASFAVVKFTATITLSAIAPEKLPEAGPPK
ncbi:MAG: type IV pilus assembly protein PilM [Planctomycetes bacterium]|nr:type IV pilus assembly protein PilM [Planctomycetota bacterium]